MQNAIHLRVAFFAKILTTPLTTLFLKSYAYFDRFHGNLFEKMKNKKPWKFPFNLGFQGFLLASCTDLDILGFWQKPSEIKVFQKFFYFFIFLTTAIAVFFGLFIANRFRYPFFTSWLDPSSISSTGWFPSWVACKQSDYNAHSNGKFRI